MVTTARRPGSTDGPIDPAMAADPIGVAAALSDAELSGRLEELFGQKASLEGQIVVLLGEVARRQSYRAEGATGPGPWAVERFGIAPAAARTLVALGERADELPHLMGALCAGALSLDKVRALAPCATTERDRRLAEVAQDSTVRELAELARHERAEGASTPSHPGPAQPTVRFNEACHTMVAQLPPVLFAEARACLEARARAIASDGETAYDERLGQALVEVLRGAGSGRTAATATATTAAAAAAPFLVVAHVALATLVGETGQESPLAAELERGGLVDPETLRRLACDATVVIALDDDVGHTMYEGRARRHPNPAQRREVARRDRHCRFPGCANVTFAEVHHVKPWKPGGRTDLDNLALLCVHHHHLVHSTGWALSGNANEELRFVGPTGRVMTSRPSRRWGGGASAAAG
jgi:hypothetical protein